MIRSSGTLDNMAHRVATVTGRPSVAIASIVILAAWFASGEHYHWSDTWQLIIQTVATVISLPLLFILQNSHNRNTAELNARLDDMQAKLDLLIERSQ